MRFNEIIIDATQDDEDGEWWVVTASHVNGQMGCATAHTSQMAEALALRDLADLLVQQERDRRRATKSSESP